ncbi:hypothetical protein [Hyalangium versicolor]|nr:hypothetical protein [Hyalangium versicolor]
MPLPRTQQYPWPFYASLARIEAKNRSVAEEIATWHEELAYTI